MSQLDDITKKISKQVRSDSPRELFRQCLRDADQFIQERRFDEAKARLEDAKAIDPGNPYLTAFRDRIKLFETATDPPLTAPAPQRSPAQNRPHEADLPSTTIARRADHAQPSRESIEQTLRQQIEAEYKTRFMQELQKAQEVSAKNLELERTQLNNQRDLLKAQFDAQLADSQRRLDAEYQKRLQEEVASVEQRLKQQTEGDQRLIENEVKTKVRDQYEDQMRQLEEKLKQDQAELIERERQSSSENEKTMRDEFSRKLVESLRATESLIHEQGLLQQREQEQLRQRLTAEFQEALTKEREAIKLHYETEMNELTQSFAQEQQRIQSKSQHQIASEMETLRKREFEELERKRTMMVRDIEAELQTKHNAALADERSRVQAEAEKQIDAEKTRLREEFETLTRLQNEKVQNVQRQLRTEMEESFLRRLEQIASQYDHKMELLGAKPPTTRDQKMSLYRERMRECCAAGQPSVQDAKRLMELREVLELSFDDHLSIESDVRLELFVSSAERKILIGELDINNAAKYTELREKFRVTEEEATELKPWIIANCKRPVVKGKVLVVDDEEPFLQLIKNILSESGHQVFTAADTASALKKLASSTVDLILSDIRFGDKELEGFEFFKKVQEQPRLRRIPFVFMSALRDFVVIRSGMQLGVDDYLTKPFDPDMLLAVVEGKLKRARSVQQRGGPPPDVVPL